MTSVLFEGSAIVTVDDSNSVLDPGWIFIRNDIIENIGKGQTPKNIRKEADEIIDASGSAIMPGMVNGHTHLFQTFFRGFYIQFRRIKSLFVVQCNTYTSFEIITLGNSIRYKR